MDEQQAFPQPDLMKLATQGDAQALGTLLQAALQNPTWQLQARSINQGLQIFWLGDQVPDQAEGTHLIHQAFSQWPSMPWSQVFIASYVVGARVPTWVSQIHLEPLASSTAPTLSALSTDGPLTPPPAGISHPPTAATWEHQPIPRPQRLTTVRQTPSAQAKNTLPAPRQLSSAAVGALLTGLVLAIPLVALGFLKVLFNGFLVMVHELGHAVTYWLFGYPAIPSVNLLYGGGITLAMGRLWLLVWAILGGLIYLIYRYRRSSNILSWLIAATGLYTLCAFTAWHTRLVAYMGHGAETLAIILCLYFAMGGYFCKLGGERTIYAMLGFFTWFADLQFAWGLLHNAVLRENYLAGIGGMLDNDFVTLAGSLGVSLDAIATFFLITSLLAPLVAGLGFRYEVYWQRALLKP